MGITQINPAHGAKSTEVGEGWAFSVGKVVISQNVKLQSGISNESRMGVVGNYSKVVGLEQCDNSINMGENEFEKVCQGKDRNEPE